MDTPSDRVQVVQAGSLRAPGTCALCGSGTCELGYVDLDIYYDWEGNVYLCMWCAKQVAHVIGCLNPEESKHLEELNLSLVKELNETKERLNDYRVMADVISRSFGVDFNAPVGSSSGQPVTKPEVQSESPSESDSSGAEQKPVSTKSSPKRRPNDATLLAGSDRDKLNV